jgi:hypothetical protein
MQKSKFQLKKGCLTRSNDENDLGRSTGARYCTSIHRSLSPHPQPKVLWNESQTAPEIAEMEAFPVRLV